jgi:hypothetical protein
MVDAAQDNGKPIGDRMYDSITGLVRDKTFMRALSNLMEWFEGGSMTKLDTYSSNFVASCMPNLVRIRSYTIVKPFSSPVYD